MEWMWAVPLNVALFLVPGMFGVWAWVEVIERIREEHAAVGRRTRMLCSSLVVVSATYLVAAGTWMHPHTLAYLPIASLGERLGLYALIALPWVAFGVVGLLARYGRRTGLTGFLEERARQERRIGDVHGRARAFLHAVGMELEATLRQMQDWSRHLDQGTPIRDDRDPDDAEVPSAPLDTLQELAAVLRIPEPSPPSDISLDTTLHEVLVGVRDLAEERGVSVFQSGLEERHVRVGPDRLRQILQVLLEGAMVRAPRGEGLVGIAIQPTTGRDIEITITDNGTGLTHVDEARAFALDPPPAAEGHQSPGLGFPLAVARRLARQDGGDLWITAAESGGTVVGLRLPTSDGAGPPEGKTDA